MRASAGIMQALALFACTLPANASFLFGCNYTEQELRVPSDLAAGKIVLVRGAYVAEGDDPEYTCLPVLGRITHQIVTLTGIKERYYTERGQSVEPLTRGRTFRVTGAISTTKHGITTMDSGPGPVYYLILADENGQTFKMANTAAGINRGEPFLEFIPDSGEPFMLEAHSFGWPTKRPDARFVFTP